MKRTVTIALVVAVLCGGVYALLVYNSATPDPVVDVPAGNDNQDPQDNNDTGGDIVTPPADTGSNPKPLPQESAQVVRTISTTQKVVGLTFDAGADRGFAAHILDTPKTEGVKASFGMTGKCAQQNPNLVKRMAAEGHDFINHTWTHASFTGFSPQTAPLTREQRWDELARTEALIAELTGKSTKPFFRPPFGDYDANVNKDIYAHGYTYNVMWTVDSLGWKGITKEQITERVVAGTVPGAIHLFHVGEQSQDAAALPMIIVELRARGYTFARISDLL